MFDLLIKLIMIVAMTHGMRVAGRKFGPRWGGLLLGLPVSTALALSFLARERGDEFVLQAAESSLLGLVAAVTMSLIFGLLATRQRGLVLTMCAAIAAYLGAAFVMGFISNGLNSINGSFLGLAVKSVVALTGVATALTLAARLAGPSATNPETVAKVSQTKSLVIRTIVPVVSLLTTTSLAGSIGGTWAGLLATFPATFVAVIFVTALESSHANAAETAFAFPKGNFAMIAFLVTVRLGLPDFGFALSMTAGYAAAMVTILLVQWVSPRITQARFGPCRQPSFAR